MKNESFMQLFIELAPRELWGAMLLLPQSEAALAVCEGEVMRLSDNGAI